MNHTHTHTKSNLKPTQQFFFNVSNWCCDIWGRDNESDRRWEPNSYDDNKTHTRYIKKEQRSEWSFRMSRVQSGQTTMDSRETNGTTIKLHYIIRYMCRFSFRLFFSHSSVYFHTKYRQRTKPDQKKNHESKKNRSVLFHCILITRSLHIYTIFLLAFGQSIFIGMC